MGEPKLRLQRLIKRQEAILTASKEVQKRRRKQEKSDPLRPQAELGAALLADADPSNRGAPQGLRFGKRSIEARRLARVKQNVRHQEEGLDARDAAMNKPTVISMCLAGEIAILIIRGRMVAGEEATAVQETIVRAGPNLALLVVNLRYVEKMDAAGLSALVFAYSYAESLGARFRLAAVSPEIGKLLSITRLSTVFSTAESPRPAGKVHGRRMGETAPRGLESWFFDRGE
jgi:anti-anti-sigma factor